MQCTVLITGGSGYIGTVTAWLLTHHQYQVVIVDTKPSPLSSVTYVAGDAGDSALIQQVCTMYQVSAVIHMAASIEVGHSVADPATYYHNNVITTFNLLAALRTAGVNQCIFSSSAAVYGMPMQHYLTETDFKVPLSPYGHTKLVGEYLLHDYAQAYELRYVVLRYFNVAGAVPDYGLGETHDPETHIIPLLLQAAQLQKPFILFGMEHATKDGSCVRDYVHVLDVAYAHLQALEHLYAGRPSDVFNIGSGTGVSVKELLTAVEQTCQVTIPIVIEKQRAGDPALLVADISKAVNILGWQPRYSDIHHIVRSAYAYSGLQARQASARQVRLLKE